MTHKVVAFKVGKRSGWVAPPTDWITDQWRPSKEGLVMSWMWVGQRL